MQSIDWMIMIIAVIALRLVSLSTRKHIKGVADFLSANRSARRYLLTISNQMGSMGSITFIGMFEMYHVAGFAPIWWSFMMIPIGAIIILTGWIAYRFRETRAMTLAQFFETRYSRRFRIFAGCLCWACGVINFGIFPAVTARFFIYFCGLPAYFHIPGIDLAISTFATIMAVDLILALSFVSMGGQVTVMVTDCVQGIVSSIALVVIIGMVMLQFHWSELSTALSLAPSDASMLNPFHTSKVPDFNIWYFLIGIFGAFYIHMSWQGAQAYSSSGTSPHEQKMGGIIGIWRAIPQNLVMPVLAIAAFAFLNLPEYGSKARLVQATLETIPSDTLQTQMRVPIALAHMLPVGIKGLLATVILFYSFTGHDTYLHSWGTIFIQDVVIPIRKKALDPQQHVRWLRYSIIGVAAYAFVFSLVYQQSTRIFMFMAITGTIWLGGSGAVIIGGLYWRRGTTAAAYSALIVGAVMGVGGLILPNIYKDHYGSDFPVNGQWLWFIAMLLSAIIYVIVSFATSRRNKAFSLERMLHRGEYALTVQDKPDSETPPSKWMKLVGITKEFSRFDRVLAIALVSWNAVWVTVFIIGTAINLTVGISDEWWGRFWHAYIGLNLLISIPATIWFAIGGVLDIKALFRTLATAVRDHSDNGFVVRDSEEQSALETRSVTPAEKVTDR